MLHPETRGDNENKRGVGWKKNSEKNVPPPHLPFDGLAKLYRSPHIRVGERGSAKDGGVAAERAGLGFSRVLFLSKRVPTGEAGGVLRTGWAGGRGGAVGSE